MSSRTEILGRIREALREPAPLPGAAHHTAPSAPPAMPTPESFQAWLPAVGAALEEQCALFAKNAADLKAEFHLLSGPEALPSALAGLIRAEGWKKVGLHTTPLIAPLLPLQGVEMLSTDHGYDPQALERCDAGITGCDALVAQTGSVLITSRSAGGRALSILPPHHVVIASRQQMVSDLGAAYAVVRRTYGDTLPSLISFITGPSRTGDIERILVLGAHGPKRLTIFCC